MKRHFARAALAAVFLGASVAPALAANGKPAVDKDTVVFAIGKEIGNLDGQVAATGDSQRYGWQVYDTLYGFDNKGHLEPRVATAVKISDDGLTYTFTLRRGVKFHDGSILTAKDVKYSVDRVLDPNTKSTRRPYLVNVIDGVSTPDDHTVVMKLKQADGAFLNKVAGYLLLVPKKYTESLGSPEAFARAPVSVGPYRFVEQKVGQYVELARFEDFYGRKPGIKRLVFKFIPDASSRVNALLAGEVDAADYIAPNDMQRLREAGFKVHPVPVGSPLAVRLYSNVPNTPLANRKVRLALNHALDTNAIIKNVLHGVGAPMASYISASYPYGVDPALKPYAYDPAKAKALLAEAGFPKGFDTELYCASDVQAALCEAVVAYWSQVNVRAKVKVMDYAAWSRLNNTHKNGPMTVMQFSNAIYDPIHPLQGGASKDGTWSDYDNPEVDKLLKASFAAADTRKRDEIFREVGRILHDDGHSVLLTELYYVYANDPSLDWTPQTGSAYYNFRDIKRK